ncbi:conserved hypothetical protein [Pirellula staleyi DSM 6068]|uniref:DUF2726 domain-containing protein n=1 Tax=Pirellula staleyi (strain ATCC 27377 / DSM 6068 / ICPB 4128) TaxID=530564 RepID=D2R7N7_PIRSD|nr:DUF2726 domain-containing protein [Pirellula staleyi]ADB17463.1 conserved hypothetical protein [Pirellula staleyi DSM 6068]
MGQLLIDNWPLLLFLLVAAVLLIIAMASLRDGPMPYERRGVLLTPAEINFLRTLQIAVRDDWQIFSMVRLADLIKVRAKTRKFQTWQNRIAGKHIDFVICDNDTLEVKLAIELDDSSHRRPDRQERDRFVNAALAAAGLPLLRIKVEEQYETALLRKDIEDALGIVRKKRR